MGVNSGPVSGMVDVNDRTNVAGTGINMAQRVMDCGDAGHILLSKRVADDLAQYRQWQSQLHDLGECQVKHEVVVSLVNLYTDELGNPALPGKFKAAQQLENVSTTASATPPPPRKKKPVVMIAAVVLLLLLVGAASWVFSHRAPMSISSTPIPPAAPALPNAGQPQKNAVASASRKGEQRNQRGARGRNPAAFDFFNRAKSLLLTPPTSALCKQNYQQAIELLNQAVADDPQHFLGYCQLASANDSLYFLGLDHSKERLTQAENALQAALGLRPDAGVTHLTRAEHLFRGYLNYDGALAEIESARRTLPTDPRLFELIGHIRDSQGQHPDAVHNLQRALELDPQNITILRRLARGYERARRYAEGVAALDRALALNPNDADTKVARAMADLDGKADPHPLHQAIESIRAESPVELAGVANSWLKCALAEHDARAAEDAHAALGENVFSKDSVVFNADVTAGLIARMENDSAKAHAAFSAARVRQEKLVQSEPDYGPAECVLGLIDAGLGRKEDAEREGRRAVELLPVAKDAINGAHMIEYLAMIDAWLGEKDLACEQLAIVARGPGAPTYGELKLLPSWESLHGDPRFEKIVASLAPRNEK